MTRKDYDEIKTLIENIDNFYSVLEKIDDIGVASNFKIISENNGSVSIDVGDMGERFNNMFRNEIRKLIHESESQLELIQIGVPSIIRAIQINHFEAMTLKGWDYTYWFFDLHGTILVPSYSNSGVICTEYYPLAKEVLQVISKMSTVKLIMYTCSYPEQQEQYKAFFKKDGINFDFINSNPEVKNTGHGYYESKPYMNVLFEDKAGFNPKEDWKHIKEFLKYKNLWPDYQNSNEKDSHDQSHQ